jgi:fumarate reductase (CoM/CoB) subunit B
VSVDKPHIARQLDYCTFCPKMSRHACPVTLASGHEGHTPQAKMQRLNELRKGTLPWSRENADPIYACTGCRHCTLYCQHNNEPATVLFAGRAEANRRGATHPKLENYPDRFRSRDRRLEETLRAQLPESKRAKTGAVGFIPGCDGIDKATDEVQDALDLFEKLSGQAIPAVDMGQGCAGYPLIAAGYTDMFRWHAARVAADVKGFRTLVVNCSACVYTLRTLYPAEGVNLPCEVLSMPEFLLRLADRIQPRTGPKPVVYYHDPCHLARFAGVIVEPRQLLSKIAEVREFTWARGDADCCGGGGLLPKTMPNVADSMARRRLREISGRGGGAVVTACATCSFMLKSNAPEGVAVFDLPAYLSSRLSWGKEGRT